MSVGKNKDSHYITNKESRQISRENRKITREFEKKKSRRNVPESEYLTEMKNPDSIVEFDDLHTFFYTDVGTVKAVDGVTFNIPNSSIVGVVGESGCGKSVTSLSLMQLVQRPAGQISSGSIRFKASDGKVYDVAKMPTNVMNKLRGKEMAMIFQEPMTSLNPVFKIGMQLDEVVLLHEADATKESAKNRSIEMLKLVGISDGERIYNQYPHELSGGMRQRVMIAMTLACNPRLIIADEPTTALDVTIQAQILDLLRDIKQKINGSIMLITHDLGVIAEMADYVVVMYAGRIIEQGTAKEIFKNPMHPYTIGLQRSKPVVNQKIDRLYSIPGTVPNPINLPDYCYFRDRCDKRCKACDSLYPEIHTISGTHKVACHLYSEEMIGKKDNKGGDNNG